MKAAAVRQYSKQAVAEPDLRRFDGAAQAARKVTVARDPVRYKTGHNREHAWILWSKIQRGHITAPETIEALSTEYKELFAEFEAQRGTQVA